MCGECRNNFSPNEYFIQKVGKRGKKLIIGKHNVYSSNYNVSKSYHYWESSSQSCTRRRPFALDRAISSFLYTKSGLEWRGERKRGDIINTFGHYVMQQSCRNTIILRLLFRLRELRFLSSSWRQSSDRNSLYCPSPLNGLAGISYSLGDSTVNCTSAGALLLDLAAAPCLFSSFRYNSLMKSSYFGSVLVGFLMMNSSSVSSTSIVAGGCSVSGRQFAEIAVRLRATKSYVGGQKRGIKS